MDSIESLQMLTYAVCQMYGWERHWKESGLMLHLEVSEFIEALRGKHGDPIEEADDILFVLFSILNKYHISIKTVLESLTTKSEALFNDPRPYNNYGDNE